MNSQGVRVFRMTDRYRYSRWDGTQQVFPVHEDDLMAQLSQHVMAQGDVSAALRTMMQRGLTGRSGQKLPGIQDLLQRLKERRQETLERYNLPSVLEDIARKLAEIVDTERRGIEQRLDAVRARHREAAECAGRDAALADELLRRAEEQDHRNIERLDALPEEPAQRIRQLSDYEFTDAEARAKFQELMDSLRRAVLDQLCKDISQRLKELTPVVCAP